MLSSLQDEAYDEGSVQKGYDLMHSYNRSIQIQREGMLQRSHSTRYVDAHIHFDQYTAEEQQAIMAALEKQSVTHLIAVSMNMASCVQTEALAAQYPRQIVPAYGYHPEQPVASQDELELLLGWMDERESSIRAVGEVGLPYYLREEALKEGRSFDLAPYEEQLLPFIQRAARWDVPIVLHAVYDDAPRVCELLERWNVRKAHFHWFKGDAKTIERMAQNGYYVSFTPDIEYEAEIQSLASSYPIQQVMSETDGPWPFEGSFCGRRTEPGMVTTVVQNWAKLVGLTEEEAQKQMWDNACRLYKLTS